MKITDIEILSCDAGWRTWLFLKISTDEGIVGWSECTESFGSPRGLMGVIEDFKPLLISEDPRLVEKLYWKMYSATRQSTGSVIQKAIAGVENALLDIKAKALGVSVADMLGGPIRDSIQLYWSHCATTRVRAFKLAGVRQIAKLADIKPFAEEVLKRGYSAIKTNIAIFENPAWIYMPGFNKSAGGPELNISTNLLKNIEAYIAVWRKAAGDRIDIILDLNFNFKTEGYIQVARVLEPYNLMWLEIDTYNADAMRMIKDSTRTPVCTGENLYGAREFRPYFERHAMDIASVDITWNGLLQSKKIADMAEVYEMNIAPHNHHSHFSTFMSANFAALIPNLRILETDVDDVPWKDDIVTNVPRIEKGMLKIPKGPGWGSEINEKELKKHPRKQ